MSILAIDHVQLAMPRGEEEKARAFYVGLLEFVETPKPAALIRRGGAWFESGSAKLHLGVEEDFRPARKAHPALLVDNLAAVLTRLEANGIAITRDAPLEGYERVHINDPFGNRIELIQMLSSANLR